MGVYKYVLQAPFRTNLNFPCPDITHEWFQVKDNILHVKPNYAWDGCSPKWKVKDLFYFGTFDGICDKNGDQILKYACLPHDVTYQFFEIFKYHGITRRQLDDDFYIRMKEVDFSLRDLYYRVIRIFGWTYTL